MNIVPIKGKLANFAHTPYAYKGIEFRTSEHHYQYLKAMFFNDSKTANLILSVPDPADAKMLSRAIMGYDQGRWENVRTIYMHTAVLTKYRMNKIAHDLLLSYDINTEFVEFSPWDGFWGVKCKYPSQLPKKWPGINMMGQILMRVRQEIEPIPEPNLFSQYEDNL